MIIALAPRLPRGCSWVWPSIVLLGIFPLVLPAQAQPSAEATKKADMPVEAAKKDSAPADKADEGDAAPKNGDALAKGDEKPAPTVEYFIDPIAVKVNENTFPQLPSGSFSARQIREVEAMAKGAELDRDLVQKYVVKFAADLTNQSYIKALIDPTPGQNPNSAAAVGFREASKNLATPIELAKRANNAVFLKVYSDALLSLAPKLLKNHLLARLETAILLGKTGSPEAIDTFISQINDKEQTVWVKVWAARGLLNVVQPNAGTYQELPGGTTLTVKAAHALVDMLADKTLHWPAQLRGLEALGSLRLASDPRAQGKLEMASAAIEILADPKARLEVRAQAAWALGMLRVNQANLKFNYKLIAYHAGEVAGLLGGKVAATYEANEALSKLYAASILYQIYPSFYGVEGARESGLLRMPSLGQNRGYVEQVGNLVKPLAKSAVELFKSPRGGREKIAKDLNDRVAALKSFLDKNVPEDTQFGEKQFPLTAEMARVPAGQPKVAGAAPVPGR